MKNKKRKILSIKTENYNLAGETIRARIVVWCQVDSESTRSINTTHFARTVYFGSKVYGVDARFPDKEINLNKKSPLESIKKLSRKSKFDGSSYNYGLWFIEDKKQDALQDAIREYLDGKKFTGTVRYTTTGETGGAINSPIGCQFFYACNADKDLKQDDKVEFTYHSKLGACYVRKIA